MELLERLRGAGLYRRRGGLHPRPVRRQGDEQLHNHPMIPEVVTADTVPAPADSPFFFFFFFAAANRLGNPFLDSSVVAAAVADQFSALGDNQVSVTPLRLDMTDEPFLTRLVDIFA